MGVISRRFRWIEQLFPPAASGPRNPSVISNDISLVHPILNGTESLDEVKGFVGVAAAAATLFDSSIVPDGKYWFVLACGLTHDDPVARELIIHLIDKPGNSQALAASSRAIPKNHWLAVPRAFIMPPTFKLQAIADAMAAGQRMRFRFSYKELNIGAPHPAP